MPAKEPDPLIEEILELAKDSLVIAKTPNGMGDENFRVFSAGENATLLDNLDELNGFEKSLKMQKITARLITIQSNDWDTDWAWSLQAKTETLEAFLKTAKKLKMDIALSDVIVGEITEEDMPRQKREQTIGDGLVAVGGGSGSGVWSGSPEEFDKMMKGMGMPSIFGTDSDSSDDENSNSSTPENRKPTADELIESMSNGTFDGDPIQGLFEIGRALSEEDDRTENNKDSEKESGNV
jgi:hypothetical protein